MGAYGVGTQRVEDELKLLLGSDAPLSEWTQIPRLKRANISLLLFDNSRSCAHWQMIAKGLDFP